MKYKLFNVLSWIALAVAIMCSSLALSSDNFRSYSAVATIFITMSIIFSVLTARRH